MFPICFRISKPKLYVVAPIAHHRGDLNFARQSIEHVNRFIPPIKSRDRRWTTNLSTHQNTQLGCRLPCIHNCCSSSQTSTFNKMCEYLCPIIAIADNVVCRLMPKRCRDVCAWLDYIYWLYDGDKQGIITRGIVKWPQRRTLATSYHLGLFIVIFSLFIWSTLIGLSCAARFILFRWQTRWFDMRSSSRRNNWLGNVFKQMFT